MSSAAQHYLWRSTKESFAVLSGQIEENIHLISCEDIQELRYTIEKVMLKGQSKELLPPSIPSTPLQQKQEEESEYEKIYTRDKQPYTEKEKEIIRTALKALPGSGVARKRARLALCREKLCSQLSRSESGLMTQIRRLDRLESAGRGEPETADEGDEDEEGEEGYQCKSVGSTAVAVGQKRHASEIEEPEPIAGKYRADPHTANNLIWAIYTGGDGTTADGRLNKLARAELVQALNWPAVRIEKRLEMLKQRRG